LIGADGAAQQAILSRSQFAELGAALIARTLSANRIHQAMFKVGDMLETDAPLAALRAAAAALSAVTDEFAARRMNASISQALAGRRMDSLA
jgi:molecular chaperone HscA